VFKRIRREDLIVSSPSQGDLRELEICKVSDIVTFIRDIREKHPRIGKEKIKKFLDEYCGKRGIKSISTSTIDKVIKRFGLITILLS